MAPRNAMTVGIAETGRADWCTALQFVGPPVARTMDGLDVHASSAVGSFAEYSVVPQSQLVAVDSTLSDDELAFLTISGSSGIGPAMIVAPVRAGNVVAVVGLGPCGLSYLQAAKLAGARQIIAIDPILARRELALSLGATDVVDPTSEDPIAAVRALGPDRGGMFGTGADLVFEATTTTEGMQQAWEMAPAGGTVVLSSVPFEMGASVDFPATPFACQGKTVHGSQQGGFAIRRDTPVAIELMEKRYLDFSAIIDASYQLDDIVKALDDVAAYRIVAGSLRFSQ